MRNRHFLLIDLILLAPLPFFVVAMRYETFSWPPELMRTVTVYAAFALLARVAAAQVSGVYKCMWRYASMVELERLLFAGALATVLTVLSGAVLIEGLNLAPHRMPYSSLVWDAMSAAFLMAVPRLTVRMLGQGTRNHGSNAKRTLLIGAGGYGQTILREMRMANLPIMPVGFLDDDPNKQGSLLGGVPVLGVVASLSKIIESVGVDEVIITISSPNGALVRRVMQACTAASVPLRIMPPVGDLISGRVSVQALRKVEIEDLLRREPVHTDLDSVKKIATGRCVLVTGAGGSIGSELCRQIGALEPTKLVALDHSENQVYDIDQELREKFPDIEVVAVIADIRNGDRLRDVFQRHKPYAVFHAAAHKHVPLMEENVSEAVSNNIIGTRNVVDAALDFDTKHFVLISTDKAVRPTSVMGATKRVAELVVRQAANVSGRNFVAVRFGNVLGSRGSVIPNFLRQIRAGGPVTVTHPEMRRFFMTIPEAVQLVLQAGVLGSGGELFVLDMGDPVRIIDLARDLIRLSGLEEGHDVDIAITGIRPGEKLYEELSYGHEAIKATAHPKVIRVLADVADVTDQEQIEAIMRLVISSPQDESSLRKLLRALVPDFVDEGLEKRLREALKVKTGRKSDPAATKPVRSSGA